jgi:pimeloyl-ACP methyl ester carboxylesterase
MGLWGQIRDRARDLRGGMEDSAHSAVYLRQLLRGNRSAREHAATPAQPQRTPVLLIHGYFATRGSLHLLERRLTERGYVVMSYRLGAMNLGDIRDSAGLIARQVESIAEQTGVGEVDIVGHSMGGLVGLYYIKRLGGRRRVRRLILLGTPARGTWSALLGLAAAPLGRASLQLLPGSPFLRELGEGPLPAAVEVVALAGGRDWFAPVSTTLLAGARHIALPTGHSGLLVDEAVVRAVDEVLQAPRTGSTGAGAAGSPEGKGGAAVDGSGLGR